MCVHVFVRVCVCRVYIHVGEGKDIVAPGAGITLDYELLSVRIGNWAQVLSKSS